MAIDHQKLIKVMMMTTSSNDAEALAAIRKANAMLAAEGATWNVLLRNPAQELASATMKPYNPPRPSGRGVFDVGPTREK